MTAPQAFTVESSNGTLSAWATSGAVIAEACRHYVKAGEDGDLRPIQRFDVDEWRKAYPGKSLDGEIVDILDLGFWELGPDGREVHVPPDEFWRAEFGPALRRGALHGMTLPPEVGALFMNDQPATCPKCGARLDSATDRPEQLAKCLGCGKPVRLVADPEMEGAS